MKLYIFGDTNYAQLVAELVEASADFELAAFTVNKEYLVTETLLGYPVVAFEELTEDIRKEDVAIFSAIGYRSMRTRQKIFERIKSLGFRMPSIISSEASVAKSAQLGDNNVVMPGCVVESGASIGSNNIVWSNVTLCHHSTIGDHNFFAANSTVGGEVSIGNLNFFGFGAIVEQTRAIENENILGAASYLNKNIRSSGKWLGVPAKKVGTHADVGVRIEDPHRV